MDPATLSAIGVGLGGMGQFVGGVSDLTNQGENTSIKLMERGIQQSLKTKLRYARKYGEKYGFHPLAALGVQPNMGPSSYVGGHSGRGFERMGQGLERMLTGRSEVDKAKARYYNAMADDIQKGKDIKKTPVGQEIPITEQNIPLKHPSYSSGEIRGRAVQPLEQLYRTGNTIVALPAEGAQDFMSESFFAMVPYAMKQIKQFLITGRAVYSPKKLDEFRDKLDKVENFLRSNNEIRPDEYLAFNMDSGQINVMRSWHGKTKYLISNRSPKYKQQPLRYGGLQFRKNY